MIQNGDLIALLDLSRHNSKQRKVSQLAETILYHVTFHHRRVINVVYPVELDNKDGLILVSNQEIKVRVLQVLDLSSVQVIFRFLIDVLAGRGFFSSSRLVVRLSAP